MKRLPALVLLIFLAACESPSFKIPAVVDNRGQVPGSLRRKRGYKAREYWQVEYNRFGRSKLRVTLQVFHKEKEAIEEFQVRSEAYRLRPSCFDGADRAAVRSVRRGADAYAIVMTNRYRYTVEFVALRGFLTRAFVEDFLRKAIPPQR